MSDSRIARSARMGFGLRGQVKHLECAIEALERRAHLSGVTFSASATTTTNFGLSLAYPPVVAADLNKDGKADLIMVNSTFAESGNSINDPRPNSISVLISNGDGTFKPAEVLPDGGEGTPCAVAVGDLNGDGAPDIVTCNYNYTPGVQHSDSISVFINNGDGTFAPAKYYANVGSVLTSVAIGDFDGHPDIAASSVFGQILLLPGNGDGTVGAPTQIGDAGLGATSMVVGDLTGNGKQDLVVTNEVSATVDVLISNGDGTFKSSSLSTGSDGERYVSLMDSNGDGNPDIVAEGNNHVSVLLGVGNGTFSPAKLTTTVYGLETTISGNIGGGITNGLVTIGGGIIPANSDGTFGSPIYMPGNTGGLAVVADVTGDGQPDVVTIGRNSNGGCVIQTEIDQTAVTPTPPPGLFPKTRPAPAVPTTGPTQPSIVLENNVLIVTGTPQTDTASVVSSEGNLTVTINSTQQAFAADQVTMIEFFTRGGNDSISIGAGSPPVLANGGGGNDTIIDTSSSPDTLSGGAGGDSLQAGSGVDLLQGGSGNDTLVAADGADTLFGNGGDDSLIGGSGASLMEGGAGDDTLVGGTGNNTLLGGDGNDSLVGGGTNLLDGNRGADTLAAGPNDTVISNSKDVVLQLS